MSKAVACQDHACCTFCHIGCTADSDPHFCLPERRCIVDTIAGHADDVAILLQAFDDLVFVLRVDPCKPSALLDQRRGLMGIGCPCFLQFISGRDGSRKADLPGRLLRNGEGIPGQHLHRYPEVLQLADQCSGIRPWCVVQGNEPDDLLCLFTGAHRHRERPVSLRSKPGGLLPEPAGSVPADSAMALMAPLTTRLVVPAFSTIASVLRVAGSKGTKDRRAKSPVGISRLLPQQGTRNRWDHGLQPPRRVPRTGGHLPRSTRPPG